MLILQYERNLRPSRFDKCPGHSLIYDAGSGNILLVPAHRLHDVRYLMSDMVEFVGHGLSPTRMQDPGRADVEHYACTGGFGGSAVHTTDDTLMRTWE